MAAHLADVVRARLGRSALVSAEVHAGEVLRVDRNRYLPVLQFLSRDPDAQLDVLVDLFAIDRGPQREPRFDVRVVLRSRRLGYRAHVCCDVGGDEPSLPTLSTLYPAAFVLERELWEMHGIASDGHPYLRPLVLYDGFVGHPLRRDYRLTKQQPLVPVLDDAPAPVVVAEADP
jgi:NADH-quinone oxidoreductase subunit C